LPAKGGACTVGRGGQKQGEGQTVQLYAKLDLPLAPEGPCPPWVWSFSEKKPIRSHFHSPLHMAALWKCEEMIYAWSTSRRSVTVKL